jgi:hypothetical protein
MAENASLYQLTQVGVETTAGTSVTATKKMTALSIETNIRADIKTYRPTGYKFPTVASLGKEWMEASLSGPLTYTEIIYALASLIKGVTPTGTTAKTWVFTPTSAGSDARKTFTVERGSAERGMKFTYGLVTGLTMNFSRDECTLSGTMLGKALQDNQALSAGATEVALLPVMPTQVQLYLADTAAGLAGATAMTRAFAGGFTLENTSGAVFPLNASSSFAAVVDTEPRASGMLRAAVDSEGMGLLTNMRAGSTKFVRIKALGDLISGSDYNMLQVDMACKIANPREFRDEQGVYAVEWEFSLVHDATWTKAMEITVVNTLATL